MPTKTAPLRLDEAKARRALAQGQAERLFDEEQRLRAQVSRAVVPGATDVARAVTLKTELRRVELAIETVVQSFPALDADVRAAEHHARSRAAAEQLTPLLRDLRLAGQEFDVSFTRFQEAKRRLEGLVARVAPTARDAGLATAPDTAKALDLLLRDVLRRQLTGEGDPMYEEFTRNAEIHFQLMETEAQL
ncbi:MAG: hypothetical protein DMD60_05120 [Gemmatimonadetes bacterium]|nr:MAG: hypothetical protein DMD60_05120 [Gemmatimonadota bacterium]